MEDSPKGERHVHLGLGGNTRLVAKRDGYPVEWLDLEPFGDRGSLTERVQFAGAERELGDPTATTDDLDFMHARRYTMHLSRFLTPDPVPGDPANPQSFNPYAYALNNPLRYTDPWGLSERDINGKTGGCDQDSTVGDLPCSQAETIREILSDPEVKRAIVKNAVLLAPVLVPRVAGGGTPVHTALVTKPGAMALNAVYRPWEGHQDAKDAVTTLSYGGYMLSTLRFVGASTEVVQGELALQAIGAYGGETVATGVLGSGLTVGPAALLVAGAGAGGMQVGRIVRERIIPESWNRAMGDALYAGTETLHITGAVEVLGNWACPALLCGR